MNVAIIGGGINGIMTAWEFLKKGHKVTLFKERKWWIEQASHLALLLKFIFPVFQKTKRSAWQYEIGLFLYDLLAGKASIDTHKSVTKPRLMQMIPQLKLESLVKAYTYFDAPMDDYKLGLWALEFLEQSEVTSIDEYGHISYLNKGKKRDHKLDKVINVTDPWSQELLDRSDIKIRFTLDSIRGSHIVVNFELNNKKSIEKCAYLLESPCDQRILFVIPDKSNTLIGTIEVRQKLNKSPTPSDYEISYFLKADNNYFKEKITLNSIISCFAGVRPLIKDSDNPNKLTREYTIQINHNLMTVFGGKWTTSRQRAKKISQLL